MQPTNLHVNEFVANWLTRYIGRCATCVRDTLAWQSSNLHLHGLNKNIKPFNFPGQEKGSNEAREAGFRATCTSSRARMCLRACLSPQPRSFFTLIDAIAAPKAHYKNSRIEYTQFPSIKSWFTDQPGFVSKYLWRKFGSIVHFAHSTRSLEACKARFPLKVWKRYLWHSLEPTGQTLLQHHIFIQ